MVIIERPKLTLPERQVKWTEIASARETLLATEKSTGSTLLVPMGWQTHDTGLVVTTLWDQQVDFTYSQSQRVFDFDTPPSYLGALGIPIIDFNMIDEWLETPDAASWNDSAGASEPSYCWAFWVQVVDTAVLQMVFSKTNSISSTGVDWAIFITSTEELTVRIFDDSANAYIGQQADAAISEGLHHIAVTKHDDSALSSSIILYVDGELKASSDDESVTYVQQEDGTNAVRIGAGTFDGTPLGSGLAGGPLGPVFRQVGTGAVWTPDVIRRDYQIGRAALGI